MFEIDNKDITTTQDFKIRARTLASDFGCQVGDTRKVSFFALPSDLLLNTIAYDVPGGQFLNQNEDILINAFMQVTCGGMISDEACRGRISDAVCHGSGQVMPARQKVTIEFSNNRGLTLLWYCDSQRGHENMERIILITLFARKSEEKLSCVQKIF